MQRYEPGHTCRAAESFRVSVIASRSLGRYQDSFEAFGGDGVVAVAVASAFYFTKQTSLEVERFLGSMNNIAGNSSIGNSGGSRVGR